MTLSKTKRRKIIDAATTEFLAQGFQGCSMDHLAQCAEVSKRTVYNHFASKEALFFAVLSELNHKAHAEVSQDYNPTQPVEQQLLGIARMEVELLQSNDVQQYARILLGELVRSDEMVTLFEQQQPSCQDEFSQWLASAAEAGSLRIGDKALAMEQFFGLLKAQAFWPTLLRKQVLTESEKQTIINSTVQMFMNSYSP